MSQAHRLYYIYHEKDESLFNTFYDCLTVLRDRNLIEDVGKLILKAEVKEDLQEHTTIDQADFVFVFLSTDFLKEEYGNDIYKQKLRIANKLREKKLLQIIPINARPSILTGTIYENLQSYPSALNKADEKTSLTDYTTDQEKIITEIARDFLDKAENLKSKLSKKTKRSVIATDTITLEKRLKRALSSQFTIERQIASGESAVLYQGFDNYLKRRVAIKVFKPWAIAQKIKKQKGDPGEARSIYGLKHPNLMTIHEAKLNTSTRYIILEYISGSSLSSILRREGPQPIRKIKNLISQLADLLHTGHKMGFLHRNITPSNIMLDRDLNPIISPFELLDASALLKKGNTTADGLRYWSPEQLSNKRINQRSDQYSLGLVLFRMITGQGLFKGVLPNEIMESREKYYKQPEEISVFLNDYYCPADLKEIVLKMLSKEPKKRFSNIKEVKLALESLMIPTINYTQLVQKSYQNCVRQGDFIINFYNKLFELSPTAAEKFAEKGLIGDEKEVNYRQRKKLRHAINMLIEYPNAKIINPMVMQKLAQNHGQGEQSLNITKNEFDQFKAALLATVANYEKDNWTVTLQKSWERTVDEGIEYMKQHAANF